MSFVLDIRGNVLVARHAPGTPWKVYKRGEGEREGKRKDGMETKERNKEGEEGRGGERGEWYPSSHDPKSRLRITRNTLKF